jgi:hypothetical protein
MTDRTTRILLAIIALGLWANLAEGFPIAYEVLPGNTADCTKPP